MTITGDHPAHPGWDAHPATFSFRRTAAGWEAVGITREPRQEDTAMSRVRYSNRRSRALLTAALVALPPVAPNALGADTAAPIARKKPNVRELHGDKLVDDYFWLREKGTPEVKAYLEAENAYTDAVMKPPRRCRRRSTRRCSAASRRPTSRSRPRRRLLLLLAHREGEAVPDLLPQEGQPRRARGGEPRRQRARQGREVHGVGDDERQRRRQPARVHDRQHRLPRVHADVKTCAPASCCEQPAEKVTSVAWAADNKTLFYTSTTPPSGPTGSTATRSAPTAAARLLYEEKDERFSVGVGRSRSKAYLFLEIGSQTTTEVRYLAGRPAGRRRGRSSRRARRTTSTTSTTAATLLHPHQPGGRNFALVTRAGRAIRAGAAGRRSSPHRADVMLEAVAVFETNTCSSSARTACRSSASPRPAPRRRTHRPLPFPEPAYPSSPAGNPEFETPTSPLRVPVVHDAAVGLRLRHGHAASRRC